MDHVSGIIEAIHRPQRGPSRAWLEKAERGGPGIVDLIKSHCLNQSVAATTRPLAQATDPPEFTMLLLVEVVLFCRQNHGT